MNKLLPVFKALSDETRLRILSLPFDSTQYLLSFKYAPGSRPYKRQKKREMGILFSK
jgi:hypothetical protein